MVHRNACMRLPADIVRMYHLEVLRHEVWITLVVEYVLTIVYPTLVRI